MDPRLIEILRGPITSVWSLELLLLLRRHAERAWQPDELVIELRASGVIVRQSLDQLERAGLVVRDGTGAVRFGPATPDLTALIELLDQEYRSKPDAVRRAIIATPDNQLKSFTDAFLIRKSES